MFFLFCRFCWLFKSFHLHIISHCFFNVFMFHIFRVFNVSYFIFFVFSFFLLWNLDTVTYWVMWRFLINSLPSFLSRFQSSVCCAVSVAWVCFQWELLSKLVISDTVTLRAHPVGLESWRKCHTLFYSFHCFVFCPFPIFLFRNSFFIYVNLFSFSFLDAAVKRHFGVSAALNPER